MKIEVAYARAELQTLVALQVPEGTSVRRAVELSGLLDLHPDIDLTQQAIGIFGRLCSLDDPVHDGDRVEVYRALPVDPKLRRRQRAALRHGQS